MIKNFSYGLQKTGINKYKFKEVLSCAGCEHDPTTEELLRGIVCKGPDKSCQGKVKKRREVIDEDSRVTITAPGVRI
jgi:hypothetical protein